MLRLVLSYVLTSIVLVSQIGLPLHLHYCKGILESVSVFVSQGCDDHQEFKNLPACCEKMESNHCSVNTAGCCNDQVSILLQEMDTLIPHFSKWELVVPVSQPLVLSQTEPAKVKSFPVVPRISADTGPPIYILHRSLIFYA